MAQKRIYFVVGGVFADGKLDRLEPDAKPECFGPFDDEAAAARVCEAQNRRNVDICWHHLYITSCLTPG